MLFDQLDERIDAIVGEGHDQVVAWSVDSDHAVLSIQAIIVAGMITRKAGPTTLAGLFRRIRSFRSGRQVFHLSPMVACVTISQVSRVES